MSHPASSSGVVEISAPAGSRISLEPEAASGDGQLRHAQRATRSEVVEEAPALYLPLRSDELELVELGGTLVPGTHRQSDSPRQLRERTGLEAGDRRIHR